MSKTEKTVAQNKVHPQQVITLLKNANLPEGSAIGELIDNAIDAAATTIEILYDAHTLSIKDNGIGMSPKTLAKAFDIGNHINKSAEFGRFGYGLSACTLKYSDKVKVKTNDGKIESQRTVDVNDYLGSGMVTSKDLEKESYTEVKLMNHSFSRLAKYKKILGYVYGARIKENNLTITVNGEKVENLVDKDKSFGKSRTYKIKWEGRSATITAGILKDNLVAYLKELLRGANFTYKGKMMGNKITSLNAFDGKFIGDVSFIVELYDGEKEWELSANKDIVQEADRFFSSPEVLAIVDTWLKATSDKETEIKMDELVDIASFYISPKRQRKAGGKEGEAKSKSGRSSGEKKQRSKKRTVAQAGFQPIVRDHGNLIEFAFENGDELLMLVNNKHQNFDWFTKSKETQTAFLLSALADFLTTEPSINKDILVDRFFGETYKIVFEELCKRERALDISSLQFVSTKGMSDFDRASLIS